MLFSLPCHLTEPGCRLSGEALQGSERCFPLLHDPTHQVIKMCEYRTYIYMASYLCFFLHYTCEHCFNTSSLKPRNPSWSLGSFRGNDRKCVKGCFFRKLSTRTSTRVTADETAALWEPVITKKTKRKSWEKCFVSESALKPVQMLLVLTNLSFHSLFGDVDICLCVKLQTFPCLSFFPNDVSVEQTHNTA